MKQLVILLIDAEMMLKQVRTWIVTMWVMRVLRRGPLYRKMGDLLVMVVCLQTSNLTKRNDRVNLPNAQSVHKVVATTKRARQLPSASRSEMTLI